MKNSKVFALFRLHFWNSHEISNVMKKKKKEPHRSSIFEVIDTEICAYLNA